MITVEVTVTVRCDRCRTTHIDRCQGRHFPDESAAIASLLGEGGWQVLPGGELLCPLCIGGAQCAVSGHDWCPWRRCSCRAGHPRSADGLCSAEFRYCARCMAYSERAVQVGAVA